ALALVDARHPGLIERFGGHAMAAGLSMRLDHVDDFKAAFVAVVLEMLDPAHCTHWRWSMRAIRV
ncbi:hypothetical protein C7E25_23460, partial [Stenotrophomonas maltophilia]